MKLKRLSTADEVVNVLGGFDKVVELTEANTKQAWNWTKRFGSFPACYMDVMVSALKRRGYTAPARLWNQKPLRKAA